MRIRKRNSGSDSTSGGDAALHQGREQRARTYRNLHHVGEQVTGRFLKRDASGHAWVSFDGLPLLAKIEGTPRPGSLLHFAIQSLVPDIVLKPLQGNAAGGGRGQAQIVVDFDTARNGFETAVRTKLLSQPFPSTPSTQPLAERRDALLATLSPEETKLYILTATGQAAINEHLSATGSARLFYAPWLLPALRCDIILRTEGKQDSTVYQELSFGFESPNLGPSQLRILSRPGRTGVRVFLEQSNHLPIARAVLRALGKTIDDSITLLGAEKPPQYAHGGILSQLLSPNPHKLMGLGG